MLMFWVTPATFDVTSRTDAVILVARDKKEDTFDDVIAGPDGVDFVGDPGADVWLLVLDVVEPVTAPEIKLKGLRDEDVSSTDVILDVRGDDEVSYPDAADAGLPGPPRDALASDGLLGAADVDAASPAI